MFVMKKCVIGEHHHCPVNGTDCHWYYETADESGGLCRLSGPWWNCDDFRNSWDENDNYTDVGFHILKEE